MHTLRVLNLHGSLVTELSPLADLKLTHLCINNMQVHDLTPLAGMPLVSVLCDLKQPQDYEILRSIKTLEEINSKPAAEFWKEHK